MTFFFFFFFSILVKIMISRFAFFLPSSEPGPKGGKEGREWKGKGAVCMYVSV